MTAKMTISAFAVLCICLAGTVVSNAQQIVQFTQYMFNPVAINPAYTGADEALKLTLVNRNQWSAVDGAPTTQGLYANGLFKRQQVGAGLSFVNDKIGIHRSQYLQAMAAYHLAVSNEATLSFGMQGGISMSRSNYAMLNTGSTTLDPQLTGAGISTTSLTIGMGMYYKSKRLHLGLSIPSLLPQTTSINDSLSVRWNRMNYLLYGKYDFAIGESVRLEPSMLLKYFPGVPLSFDVNACLVIRDALTLGLSYRNKESVDFLLRAQLTKQLQFGYSYDHVTGEAANLSRATHELSISYLFKYSHDNVDSPR